MLNNIKTETKMSRLLFYYTSIKITYLFVILEDFYNHFISKQF